MAGNRASFLFRVGNLYLQIEEVSIGTQILQKANFFGYDPDRDDYEAEGISSGYRPTYTNCWD
jgi:hypothetical protein